MRIAIELVMVISLTVSCSSSKFGGDARASKTSNASSAAASDSKKDGDTTYKGEDLPPTIVVTEAAPAPVAISGSPLTCIRTPEASKEVRCNYQEADGRSVDPNPTVGFIISGQDSAKTPVELTRVSPGLYTFQIPSSHSNLSAFAVGLGSTDADVQVSVVGEGQPDLLNVVKDSSFEEYEMSPDSDIFFVQQGQFKNWFGTFKGQAFCVNISPILKIQRNNADNLAYEGKNWADMEAVCADDYSKQGGNSSMFQDLSLKKGHLYMISYAVKHSGPEASPQRLVSKWDEDTLVDKSVIGGWTLIRSLKVARDNKVRLTFDEIGTADGFGTLIDDVRVFDLGLPILP